jgi:hypothetical protein
MLRRIGVLTSLAVVAAMFAGVTSANAQAGDAGACVFTGLSGQLNQPIPPGLTDPLIQEGTYSFTGTDVTCAGVFGGQVITPLDDITLTSNGHYDNIVCGTGFAADPNGSGTTLAAPAKGLSVSNVGYEISFVAGVGPLRIGPPNVRTAPPHLGDPITGNYRGGGVVAITPQNHTPPNDVGCVTAPTAQFEVAGAFVAAG